MIQCPVGESRTSADCPVDDVVISGDWKGDRPVESPDARVFVAGGNSVRPDREASKLTGRSEMAETGSESGSLEGAPAESGAEAWRPKPEA